jgi:hypothetical protein
MECFINRWGRCGFPRTAVISARIESATSPTGVVTALAYPFAKSSASDRYLRLAVDPSFAVTRRLGARDRRLAGRAAAWRRSPNSAFSTALATLLTSVLSAAASSGVISPLAACDLRALPDRSTRYFTRRQILAGRRGGSHDCGRSFA